VGVHTLDGEYYICGDCLNTRSDRECQGVAIQNGQEHECKGVSHWSSNRTKDNILCGPCQQIILDVIMRVKH